MYLFAADIRRLQVIVLCVIAALAAILAVPAQAATYPAGFEERTIASGLTGPVGVAWTPDGRMLVIEKDGRLKVAPAAGGAPTTVLDISARVSSYWDRGLLGVAVDSAFASNRYIYLLYTYEVNPLTPDSSGADISRLSRFELSPTNQVSNEVVLLGTWNGGACPAPSNTVDCIPSEGASHSIGSVRSAPDGTLCVGSGDASSFWNVDPLALRTYDEQSMPARSSTWTATAAGWPATRSARPRRTSTTSARSCTPRASATHSGSSSARAASLVVGDVGWDTREEVDFISAGGKSYGWPCYEGTIRHAGLQRPLRMPAEYAKEGTANAHAPPVHDYRTTARPRRVLAGPDLHGERVSQRLPRHDLLRRLRRRLHQATAWSANGLRSRRWRPSPRAGLARTSRRRRTATSPTRTSATARLAPGR